MKEPPLGFQTQPLIEVLETQWQLKIQSMEYVAVGFGAHHWRASAAATGDLFLSVHELDLVGRFGGDRAANFELLRQALETARWLESVANLDFVLGPLPDQHGGVLRRVADQYALHVYPWTDCETLSDPAGIRAAELIALLHTVTDCLPMDLTRKEDFQIPHRGALEAALGDLEQTWNTGPYAEPAREQLRQHQDAVRALLAAYDRLAERASSSTKDWVVTHGEPSGPNLIRSATNGRVHLVDWDTALIAPRERDLWELAPVAQLTYGAPLDTERLRLYKAWYTLAELAVYLAVFRSPHTVDENVTLSWENFLMFLP